MVDFDNAEDMNAAATNIWRYLFEWKVDAIAYRLNGHVEWVVLVEEMKRTYESLQQYFSGIAVS
ncbi:hypothetical protein C7271_10915 [filamentous cyanobacterium CCP5]|nr:hypothetical protein C7271_10915 [filamentous cyanobacterium CCP5]